MGTTSTTDEKDCIPTKKGIHLKIGGFESQSESVYID